MAIPDTFTCSGCKDSFELGMIHLPVMVDAMTEEELESICEGEHSNFGILCDDCKKLYNQLEGMKSW